MQNVPSTIVAGLYLTQLMLQVQLNEATSEMNTAELKEFTISREAGELSDAGQQVFYQALSKTMELLVEQFGLLQATQLTRGLFKPAVLKAIIQHLMTNSHAVDWNEVGQEIPRTAERFKVTAMINHGLNRDLGPLSAEQARKGMEKSLQLLDLAWFDDLFSSDADYRYMQIWSQYLPEPRTLCESLYKVGVRPRDEEGSSTAVENLYGTESGEFEAFCILYSLGPELAEVWEKDQVIYGNDAYVGAVERAERCIKSTERDAFFASALAAGYPVQDPAMEADKFSDLIIQIPGFVDESEQWLVTNLIQSIAPLLYQTLSDDRCHKSQTWRGLSLSPFYEQTQNMLEDTIGASGWMPAVRLRVEAFANQHNRANEAPAEPDYYMFLARKHRTPRAPSLRVTYLIDQLCDIIEHDFYAQKFLS